MDRMYFKAAMAAGELQQSLIKVAKMRNFICETSYKEAADVKNVYENICDLKEQVENIIAEQIEYMSHPE